VPRGRVLLPLNELDDVAAGDAAVTARARHAVQVEPIFGGEAAHGRGQALVSGARDRACAPTGARGDCGLRRVLLDCDLDSRRHRRRGGRRSAGRRSRARRLRSFAHARLDHGQHRADGDRRAGRHEDLRDEAVARRRDLHRDLVGLDVEDDFVGDDLVADFFVPVGDGALGDGLTELRHQYVHRALSVPFNR
jgi:hypothetical protein